MHGSQMVKYFLKLGYRSEKREKDSNTPLHMAVKSKNFATIKLLARRPNINYVNYHGCSPLAAAIAIDN
jgi:hypothetical protein